MVNARARAVYAASLAAATALAFWVVWPAFTPGRIVNLDAPRHLLRAVVMARQFLPSGHVDGWSPYWYLGAQLFLFQSYGYFFLIGATAILVAPLLSLEAVFKVFFVLPVVALPAATALLARRLGVSPRGAVAAAIASITFSSPQGYGVQGIFGIGLLLQGAGMVGFALAWPEVLAVLLDRRRAPWKAVLLLAGVLLVHFITGAYALAAAGLVAAGLALAGRDPWPLLRYGLVAGLVLLLAGHSLFPSLELREMSGAAVGWGADRDRLARLVTGALFGARPLALAALAAAAWSLRFAPRPLSISAALLFGTAVLGGTGPHEWEPRFVERVVDMLFRPRSLPYAALLQAVFAGVAVDLASRAGDAVARRAGRPLLATGIALAVATAFAVVAAPRIAEQRRFVRTESMLASPNREVWERLVVWLRANVKPPAVVALPRTLLPQSTIGARSAISLVNLDTGLYTLAGDQAELQRSARGTGRIDLDRIDQHPGQSAARLRAAGVSHVIVSRSTQRRRLDASREFELLWEFERPGRRPGARRGSDDRLRSALGVAVFRVRGGGAWLSGPGVEVRRMQHSPERIVFDVAVSPTRRERPVAAALNWHPNWKARADGLEVPTQMSPARRVSFVVPAGSERLELEFVRGPREKAYNALSAATLAFVLASWARSSRRRRPAAAA